MDIVATNCRGKLDVNQIDASPVAHLESGTAFAARTRGPLGKKTLRHACDGQPCEAPATGSANAAGPADPLIELAGTRCELTIDVAAQR